MDLTNSVNALITFDETLTEKSGKNRVRDHDHSTFKLIFTPYVAELIFKFRTPDESRTHHKALRCTFVIQPSTVMENFLKTTSRMEFRNTLGRLSTTVVSDAFSCLGLFGTNMGLMVKEPDGTVTLTDTVNEVTNDHWPNAGLFYQRVYDHSVRNRRHIPTTNFDDLYRNEMLFPTLVGKRPSFEITKSASDHSVPPLPFLTSVVYTLN